MPASTAAGATPTRCWRPSPAWLPIAYLLVIEPNAPEVVLWSRGTDRTWQRQVVSGIDRDVAMPEIGVTLRLSDLYDGVEFPVRPRLVGRDEQPG
jgi:hypothetical protein